MANEENNALQSQIDALQAELSRVKPSISTSANASDPFLDPHESDDLLNFQGAPSFDNGADVQNLSSKVPIFHDSHETMNPVRWSGLWFVGQQYQEPF